jgi:deoxyribonuclease V
MQITSTTRWDVTPSEAVEIQRSLSLQVNTHDARKRVHSVAGVDVGFEGVHNEIARAAIVVLRFPDLAPIDYAIARSPVTFPYIPGLLSFREIPVILKALKTLKTEPDILIVDGQGRAHPRRIGIASHLGVLLDRTTIGCAKSILVGTAPEPDSRAGHWSPLVHNGEVIGAAVRTRDGVSPVYVSIGHRISLPRAIEIVLQCCKGYRLPETTRYAHRLASGEELEVQQFIKAQDLQRPRSHQRSQSARVR